MEDNTEHINKKLKPSPESDEDVDIKPMIPELNNIDMLTLPRICARCRIDFVDERNLRSHFLKYRNQASFSCELCHKSYLSNIIICCFKSPRQASRVSYVTRVTCVRTYCKNINVFT
uniref:C2H2-type domain-containing protein n=1 Tax=Cacopsylla melanoneura TaxID=428564 RepID=A0A8D8W6V6_9HEMI